MIKHTKMYITERKSGVVENVPKIQSGISNTDLPNEYQISENQAHATLFVNNTLVLSNYTCLVVATVELQNEQAGFCETFLQVIL